MKHLHQTLLLILFILPLSAFAHGEEILYAVFVQVISMVVFSILMIALKLKLKHKLILTVTYALSVLTTLAIVDGISYLDHITTISLLLILVPAITFLVTFFVLKLNTNKIG